MIIVTSFHRICKLFSNNKTIMVYLNQKRVRIREKYNDRWNPLLTFFNGLVIFDLLPNSIPIVVILYWFVISLYTGFLKNKQNGRRYGEILPNQSSTLLRNFLIVWLLLTEANPRAGNMLIFLVELLLQTIVYFLHRINFIAMNNIMVLHTEIRAIH